MLRPPVSLSTRNYNIDINAGLLTNITNTVFIDQASGRRRADDANGRAECGRTRPGRHRAATGRPHSAGCATREPHAASLGAQDGRGCAETMSPGISALGVSVRLSEILDATLIHQRYSRLVYDCNRPPEATDSIPEKSEVFHIPANANLTLDERRDRARVLYTPFQEAIGAELDRRVAERREKPVLVTSTPYTGVISGRPRPRRASHDGGRAAGHARLAFGRAASYRTTTPIFGDGVTHTLRRQALPRGIPNVMIEICNAHIRTRRDRRMGRRLNDPTAGIERLDHAAGGNRSVA